MTESRVDAQFETDWLTLREPADHRARDPALTDRCAAWLADRAAERSGGLTNVVDLGAGRGSNLAYLAPRLNAGPGSERPLRQHWRLLDHDPGLLARAAERPLPPGTAADLTVETEAADLAGPDLSHRIHDADLVTAAALFDLVDARWIEYLARACRTAGAAVLYVLTIDGHIGFDRPDADDVTIIDLLRAHQQRDKGIGRALGADAPDVLARSLRAAGYDVYTADSRWQLKSPRDATLAEALITGWRHAAIEQAPAAAADVTAWARRRIRAMADGHLVIEVGHRDLFGRPTS